MNRQSSYGRLCDVRGGGKRNLFGVLVVSHKNERALNPSQCVLLSLNHFGFRVSGGMTKS